MYWGFCWYQKAWKHLWATLSLRTQPELPFLPCLPPNISLAEHQGLQAARETPPAWWRNRSKGVIRESILKPGGGKPKPSEKVSKSSPHQTAAKLDKIDTNSHFSALKIDQKVPNHLRSVCVWKTAELQVGIESLWHSCLGLLPASPQISHHRGSARMGQAMSTGNCATVRSGGTHSIWSVGWHPCPLTTLEEHQYD